MNKSTQRSAVLAYPHFWLCFANRLRLDGYPTAPVAQSGANWMKFPLGPSGYYFHTAILVRTDELRIGLTLQHRLAGVWFEELQKHRVSAESDFGDKLDWQAKADLERRLVTTSLAEVDVADATDWDRSFGWASAGLFALDRTFRSRMETICHMTKSTK